MGEGQRIEWSEYTDPIERSPAWQGTLNGEIAACVFPPGFASDATHWSWSDGEGNGEDGFATREAAQEAAASFVLRPPEVDIEPVRAAFATLTDEQRKEIVRDYCHACMTPGRGCQCWNDE